MRLMAFLTGKVGDHDKPELYYSCRKRILDKLSCAGCFDVFVQLAAIMHGLVRLVSEALHPFQIAFFRNIFCFVSFTTPAAFQLCNTSYQSNRLHVLRGVINIAAMLMFFTAPSITPLAKITALSFSTYLHGCSRSIGFRRTFSHLQMGCHFNRLLGMLIILRPDSFPSTQAHF